MRKNKETSPSLAEQAYRLIEEMIVTQELPPGTMISEGELGEQLECGRTPIREALQRLKLEGYIEVHPRRGALVTSADVMRQLELLEVRRPLEDTMIRLATARATAPERTRLSELGTAIMRAADCKDQHSFYNANKEIHSACAAATHNETLIKAISPIHGLSRRFWYTYIGQDQLLDAAKLHSSVVLAVSCKEEAAARQRSANLMDYLEELTKATIERRF